MTYTDETPAAALAGAKAIAESYVKIRNPANGKNMVATLVGPPELPSSAVPTNYPVVLGVAVMGGLLSDSPRPGPGTGTRPDSYSRRGRATYRSRYLGGAAASVVEGRPQGRSRPSASRFVGRSRARRSRERAGVQPLVTSVGTGCNSTGVAAQTALALARMGRVAILVTADHDVIASLSPGRRSQPGTLKLASATPLHSPEMTPPGPSSLEWGSGTVTGSLPRSSPPCSLSCTIACLKRWSSSTVLRSGRAPGSPARRQDSAGGRAGRSSRASAAAARRRSTTAARS